jgi:hypothetical protein
MSRYFFNMRGPLSVVDEEGAELPGLAAVRREAIARAKDLLLGPTRPYFEYRLWRMEVRNEANAVVLKLNFGDTLDVSSLKGEP